MPKELLLIIALVVIILTGILTLLFNNNDSKLTSKIETDTAINQANYLYSQEKARGRDFSDGSCLSDALMPGWVVDIVHNPRLTLDDLSQNQCPAYVEGKAKHFVELDTEGNLIRAK